MKVAIAGGSPTVIATSNQQAPGPIAVDATYLYGASFGAGLFKIPLTGGAPIVLAPDGSSGLAVTTSTVVWLGGHGLQKVPIGGGTPVVISEAATGPIATDGTYVFWARVDGSVISTSISGGADKVLANFQYPHGIAVDATSVYWTRDIGSVMKVPRR